MACRGWKKTIADHNLEHEYQKAKELSIDINQDVYSILEKIQQQFQHD